MLACCKCVVPSGRGTVRRGSLRLAGGGGPLRLLRRLDQPLLYGKRFAQPPLGERIWTFPNSYGYDGQWYHYIAHDPWFHRGFAALSMLPYALRRILLPALANLLAADRIAISIRCTGTGARLGRARFLLAEPLRQPSRTLAVAGTCFPVHAERDGIDRPPYRGYCARSPMCGFVWFLHTDRGWPLYALLLAAPLVRETGFLLLVAVCSRYCSIGASGGLWCFRRPRCPRSAGIGL